MSEKEPSLAPFFYGLGVATGVGFWFLSDYPHIAIALQPFVILGDMGIYSFFTWLFWDDMRLQFKNRLKHLRGTIGFKWARASSPDLTAHIQYGKP